MDATVIKKVVDEKSRSTSAFVKHHSQTVEQLKLIYVDFSRTIYNLFLIAKKYQIFPFRKVHNVSSKIYIT